MLVTCVGILVADIIAADLPKISDPGELTFTERSIELHIGGHSANVSIDLIKLGLEENTVSSVGAVGEDIFGNFIENTLKGYGVKCHLQKVVEAGTSKDLILVVRGEDRRYHADAGANIHLSLEYVRHILHDEKPIIFYVGGAGLLGEFDERLPEILREAKEMGCLTFLDPVSPYKHDWDIFIPALKWTDIFHCNNIEAERMTGEHDIERSTKRIIDEGTELTIITFGERGLIARTREAKFRMPAFKVPIVDPTGAGDAFCAGVIYSMIQTARRKRINIADISAERMLEILLHGEAAGAACVMMVGTTTGVMRDRVDRILREQGSIILGRSRIERD